MNILYFLVPLALVLAGVAVYGFIWAVRNGQYEDLETPGIRMITSDLDADSTVRRREEHAKQRDHAEHDQKPPSGSADQPARSL